jgi:hypothetical protein
MRRARHVRGECCGLSDDPEDLPIHVRKRGLVTLRKELLPYMCTEFTARTIPTGMIEGDTYLARKG